MDNTPENEAATSAEAGHEELENRIRARFWALEKELRKQRARSRMLTGGLVVAIAVAAGSWVDTDALGLTTPDDGVVEASRIVLLGPEGQLIWK